MQTVGFIGLGAIGWPMAAHVVREFRGVVWNRTASKAQAFGEETGARVADSPAELVAACDAVITCLPTSREVASVVDAAGDAWREGQLLVDATSGDPAGAQETAERLAARGVGFVDAPVSGGTSGAERGKLTVMLGGEARWVELAKRVVAPYAGQVSHVGPVGAAHALKAVNQALLAVNIQAAGEGLAALVKFGVDPRIALEVLNAATGRSNVTEHLFPNRVVTRAWPRTFRLSLLDKDVGVALDTLEAAGIHSALVRAVKDDLAAARAALADDDADHVEMVKVIEEAAGVEIRGGADKAD